MTEEMPEAWAKNAERRQAIKDRAHEKALHITDLDLADEMYLAAKNAGWALTRRTSTHFIASKAEAPGLSITVSVWVKDGAVRVATVTAEDSTVADVVAVFEQKSEVQE